MKTTFFSILLFFFFVAPIPVLSQDFLVARVEKMDKKELQLSVQSIKTPVIEFTVRIAVENDLPQESDRAVFPECVVLGETIRLWGHQENSGESIFIATDIRGCRHGGCSDPTGVRARLRKIRQHDEQEMLEEDGYDFDFGTHGMGEHGNRGGKGGGNGGGNGGGGGGNR